MSNNMDDQHYLNESMKKVFAALDSKGQTWASNADAFENFDLMKELGVSPHLFGLIMCRLKMNRLKSSLKRTGGVLVGDADAKDCLLDLASYAILTLGILEREEARSKTGPKDTKSEEKVDADIWETLSVKKKDVRKFIYEPHEVKIQGEGLDETRPATVGSRDVGRDGPIPLPPQHQGDSRSYATPGRPIPQRRGNAPGSVGERPSTEGDFFRVGDTGNPDNTDLGTLI